MPQNIAFSNNSQYSGNNNNNNNNNNKHNNNNRISVGNCSVKIQTSSGGNAVNSTNQWNYCNIKYTEEMNQQLPSTVDMNAFKAGPSDTTIKDVNLSSSSSDSDGSDSSSESDSSSSFDEKDSKFSTKTAQFSVTSSDAAGLRMKIAAIPNSSRPIKTSNTTPSSSSSKSVKNNNTNSSNNNEICNSNTISNKKKSIANKNIDLKTKKCENVSSSSSCCSDCDNDSDSESSSDDDDDEEDDDDDESDDDSDDVNKNGKGKPIIKSDDKKSKDKKIKNQTVTSTNVIQSNNQTSKNVKKQLKIKKNKANRNGSTSSGGGRTDTSESDSSDDLLKEINEEDLAAILPTDELNIIDSSNSNMSIKPITNQIISTTTNATLSSSSSLTNKQSTISTNDIQNADCASSSDTDLPALVSAAIQRVESCSDTESNSNSKTVTPSTQYNISLLRDFVTKTQMLGNSSSVGGNNNNSSSSTQSSDENNKLLLVKQNQHQEFKLEKEIKTESHTQLGCVNNDDNNSKKKRGRPKKPPNSVGNIAPTIESPDSGILSTPQSPAAESPKNNNTINSNNNNNNNNEKKIRTTTQSKNNSHQTNSPKKDIVTSTSSTPTQAKITKLNLTSLEKCIYATERVLYPPRRVNKRTTAAVRQTRSKSVGAKKEDNLLDPMWRKIDINKKFRRPSTSGYKSDGGSTVCSKKLAAQSGYVSDYSSVNHNKCSSGYRSDYSTKSRKSGYRSDFSTKAKSCGYRSDCSIRHRKKVRRKRRTKTINTKTDVNEQDILQLACLTLGQTSEESSRDSYVAPNTTIKPSILTTSFLNITNGLFSSSRTSLFSANFDRMDSGKILGSKDTLSSFTDKLSSKRNNNSDTDQTIISSTKFEENRRSRRSMSTKPADSPKKLKDSDSTSGLVKSQSIKMRRASTLSRCSSRSTSSRHPLKRRRRRRLKSRSRSESIYKANDSTAVAEIDDLISSFTELCQINLNKTQAEKKINEKTPVVAIQSIPTISTPVPTGSSTPTSSTAVTSSTTTTTSKRVTKKRKGSEHAESPSTTASGKRRHKKAVPTQSPDEHKLPLKKRHYLLTPGEKSDNLENKNETPLATSTHINEKIDRTRAHIEEPVTTVHKHTPAESLKVSSKAVTPKKRHLLHNSETKSSEVVSAVKTSNSPLTLETTKTQGNVTDSSITEAISIKSQHLPKPKSDIITRKKNRLESLVSKMQTGTTPEEQIPVTPPVKTTLRNSTVQSGRPTVIRTPGLAPPPGVFEPTIDLELQIPCSTISIPSMITKAELLDSPRFLIDDAQNENDETNKKSEKLVESLLNKTGGNLLLKKKRKKINRTGFPTVRKKKKRISEKSLDEFDEVKTESLSTSANTDTSPDIGDRVPKEGETADTFIERNARPRLSVISLERLQGKVPNDNDKILEMSIDDNSGTKRQLRMKANIKDKNVIKKRERDGSQDLQSTSKKSKNDIIEKLSSALSKELNKKKDSRDISSDNEPLIKYVNKTNSKSEENVTEVEPAKINKTQQKSKDEKEKENLSSKPEDIKMRASRRQSFSANKIMETIKTLRNSTAKREDFTTKPECVRVSLSRKSTHTRSASIIPAIDTLPPSAIQMILNKKLEEAAIRSKSPVSKVTSKTVTPAIEPIRRSKTMTPLSTQAVLNATLSGIKRNLELDEKSLDIDTVTPKRPHSRSMSKALDGKPDTNEVKEKVADPIAVSKKDELNKKFEIKEQPKKPEIIKETRSKKQDAVAESKAKESAKLEIARLDELKPKLIDRRKSLFRERTANKKVDSKPVEEAKTQIINEKIENKDIALIKSKAIQRRKSMFERKNPIIDLENDILKPTKEKRDQSPKIIRAKKNRIITEITSPTSEELEQIDLKSAEYENILEHDPLPEHEGKQPQIVLREMRDESPASTNSDSILKKNPKFRKKYLNAGLLSVTYKEDEIHKILSRSLSKLDQTPIDGGLLPPPPYCENYLRQAISEFQLPYDLWWFNEYAKLPGRDTVPSWNYRKVRTNIYGDVKANPSTDHQPCSCKQQAGCPDDCLNRLVYTECRPETCPCGDKCQNQKIQKHEYSPGIERYMTENKGWGIRTNQTISKGSFILEYLGEVVTEREFKDRMATRYARDTHHYCLHLDGGLVIDGHRMGSDGRFVNHSCSPNCEIQKWSVNGLFRMALFALREIQPGEELTYDYNFSLFNPAEGQPCRCDTPQCRGVIGGKSQRIKPIMEAKPTDQNPNGRTGRQRKRQAKKNQQLLSNKDGSCITTFQPPTVKERSIIRNSHCFLIRNLEKIRKLKERTAIVSTLTRNSATPQTLTAQISALRVPRNIKTRGLALVEHDPELEKTARIAGVLREICQELANYKDESIINFMAKLNIPSKKKSPKYFELIKKPIDLSLIEVNVEKGIYKNPKLFDDDIMRIFENSIIFYGKDSKEFRSIEKCKLFYKTIKEKYYEKLLKIFGGENDFLKEFLPILNKNELMIKKTDNVPEDIIRCLCGLFKDEGLMIQCSKCMVWQHTECTQADTSIENYLCERCDTNPKRRIDLEIPLNEYTEEGYRYYLSLLRGNLQIRQSDTVYVLRDIPIDPVPKDGVIKKHTYETIGDVDYAECDIFRVERLWKDKNNKKFIFGHHYLRPHETYHEPTRKFYQNEVVRVPLYEIVPIELVMAKCWVLDPTTYCKGRPIDSIENHVYICELRVDKAAKMFAKISKHAYPVCTKNYAFRKFEQRLKISKTYAPHDLNSVVANKQIKPKKEKKKTEEFIKPVSRKNSTSIVQLIPPPPKTISEKRSRLEVILSKLLFKQQKESNLAPIDLSYLLTGRGARLRRANATIVPI